MTDLTLPLSAMPWNAWVMLIIWTLGLLCMEPAPVRYAPEPDAETEFIREWIGDE
jgi:hypothetical protein